MMNHQNCEVHRHRSVDRDDLIGDGGNRRRRTGDPGGQGGSPGTGPGPAAPVTLIVYMMTAGHPLLSVANMVTVDDPPDVGVPDSSPPDDSVIPAGSVPLDTENVYSQVPPLAVSVCVYATPTAPAGVVGGAIVMVGQTGGATAAADRIGAGERHRAVGCRQKRGRSRRRQCRRAMSAFETTVPGKLTPSRVAWVGTRHHTLHGSTPFRMTVEADTGRRGRLFIVNTYVPAPSSVMLVGIMAMPVDHEDCPGCSGR